MSKVLLVGDTSHMPNVGSQATSNGLLRLLERDRGHELASYLIEDVLSLNSVVCASSYSRPKLASLPNVLWKRTIGRIDPSRPKQTRLDSVEAALERLARQEALVTRLRQADVVVINGEGAIHHCTPTAWTLLCIGNLAKQFGKSVVLANSTVESMEHPLAKKLLAGLDHIWVREWYSHLYLDQLGIDHTVAADCAAWAQYGGVGKEVEPNPGGVLLTGGVGSQTAFVERIVVALASAGHKPAYLSVDKADLRHVDMLKRHGLRVVHGGNISWRQMPAFLQGFSLLISGRHHVNLFSILAGVPFVPIRSNSWKIEGTLALCGLGKDLLSPQNLADLNPRVEQSRRSHADLAQAREKLMRFAERHSEIVSRVSGAGKG